MSIDADIEDRRTLMFVGPRDRYVAMPLRTTPCRTCRAPLVDAAHYCGMCGQRVHVPRESLTGAMIDCYEVHEKLADGGFATVYRARTQPSGEEVALKVLHADRARDPLVVERFRREARCLLRLRDRHTVAAYDFGTFEDAHYLAMELLHGETLRDRLRAHALPWRHVLVIMRAVCASLVEAHELGYVHRDLKPANIVLCTDGNVKLIDFGLAKRFDTDEDLTATGQAVGTLQYMSPEQILDTRCDARSDIYALGVIGYEALTGRRPFGRATSAEHLVTAFLTQEVRPASMLLARRAVPAEVDELLLRCLASKAVDRYATVGELAATIDRILAIRVGTAKPRTLPAPAVVPPPPPVARSRWFLHRGLYFLVGGAGVGTALARLL